MTSTHNQLQQKAEFIQWPHYHPYMTSAAVLHISQKVYIGIYVSVNSFLHCWYLQHRFCRLMHVSMVKRLYMAMPLPTHATDVMT